MKMLLNIKNVIGLFISLTAMNVSAVILNSEQVSKADLISFQNEITEFKSIGIGIALSMAQCDGVELCSPNVGEEEIKELINALNERINNLILKQKEAEEPAAFNEVLTTYVNERDGYSAYLEKLQSIKSSLDENKVQQLKAFEDEELEDDEFEEETNEPP